MDTLTLAALAIVAGLTVLVTATMRASGGWGGVARGSGVYMLAVTLTAVAAVLVVLAVRLLAS